LSSRNGFWIPLVAVLLVMPLAGCGGDDDDDDDDQGKKVTPIAGTYVGTLPETDAFVAVAAAPPARGADQRQVTVFVCDGRRVCEWFPGSATGNSFSIDSEDDDAKAEGELTDKAAKGTIELGDEDPVRYDASSAPATAGVYNLTVTAKGKVRGASEAGVALKGDAELPAPGTGTLKLADGKRVKFDIATGSADGTLGLRPGQLRLIIQPDRKVAGAGMNRGGGTSLFFVRSSD
jgi:hypothetical protein